MTTLRELLLATRPPSPLIAASAFLVAGLDVERGATLAIAVGGAYFLVGQPILRAGAAWLTEPTRTDRWPIGSIVALANGPLLLAIALTSPPLATLVVLVAATIAIVAVVPPFRWLDRPGTDVVAYAALLVLPAVAGLLTGGRAPADLPWAALLALVGWAVARRAIESIAAMEVDLTTGRGSVASRFGVERTAAGALAGFAFAAFVALGIGGLALVAALGLAAYVLLPLAVLCRPDARQADRATRSLGGIDLLVGSLVAGLLLVHWGVIRTTPGQVVAALAIAGPAVCLGQLLATDWLLRVSRRRAMERAATVQPRLPRLSIVVLADVDVGTTEPLLNSLAAQDHPDIEIIVVTSAPAGAEVEAGRLLSSARPWSADRDRVVVASTTDRADRASAIAAGIEAASGDHALVVTADAAPAVGALRELHEIALASKAGLVSGVPMYTMASLAEQAFVPSHTMALLGWRPLWATLATRGRYRRLAFAHDSMVLVERTAYEASRSSGRQPSGLGTAVDLARAIAAAGRPIRLVDSVDLIATRPYPDGWGAIEDWRRSGLAGAGDTFAALLCWIIATSGAWLLPLLAPLAGIALGDRELAGGGIAAVAVLATFRVVLALIERQPLVSVALHPVTAGATVGALVLSLADGVLGRPVGGPAPPDVSDRA